MPTALSMQRIFCFTCAEPTEARQPCCPDKRWQMICQHLGIMAGSLVPADHFPMAGKMVNELDGSLEEARRKANQWNLIS